MTEFTSSLTRDTGRTKFIIDEFGVGMVVTVTIAAIIICRTPAPAGIR